MVTEGYITRIRACLYALAIGVVLTNTQMPSATASAPLPIDRSALRKIDLSHLPLSFEANAGQSDASVAFLTRSLGGTVFFRPKDVVFSLPTASAGPRYILEARPATSRHQAVTLQVRFLDANPAVRLVGGGRQAGTVNYLIGNDPAGWRSDIPTFARVEYGQLYPGIDLRYEGTTGRLKATYVVAAGASPTRIRWRYIGAEAMHIDPVTRDLRISLAAPNPIALVEQAPIAWQTIGGERVGVEIRYATADDGSIRFALGAYDRAYPLVIDPTLTYASYLGGNGADYAYDIAVDSAGNFYVTGATGSTGFPLANPLQSTQNGIGDVFVTKFNAHGSTLAYSTYLGGNDSDVGFGVAVDSAGSAYVTGESWSNDFPVVNAIQPYDPGIQQDVIVLKLSPAGNSLIYSTYLGGHNSQTGWDIAVDAVRNVYVTGHTISSTFPVVSAFQPQIKGIRDAFVTKINAAGTALVYSTFLGSSGDLDYGFSIAVDSAGSAYVTGQTTDNDFPTVNALQQTNGGFGDAFVSKITPSGAALVYSTYLGGAVNEQGRSIAVDSAGNVYVAGWTESVNFPTVNALQPLKSGYEDAFLTKINAAGSALVYSTFLGGSSNDGNFDVNVAVDGAGNAYLAGNTDSTDFPIVDAVQSTYHGYDSDAFVAKVDAEGTTLVYSTYLGGTNTAAGLGDYAYGLALDGNGNAYVTGYTFATNFPLAGVSFQSTNRGNFDAFVAVINDEGSGPPPDPETCTTNCLRVAAIDLRTTATGVAAGVTIRNESGVGVPSASVTITWNLPRGGITSQFHDTNAQGRANFLVTGGAGTYTFTVTNVAKTGSTFDSNGSTVLSKSITK